MWKKTVDKYGQMNCNDEEMIHKKFFRLASGQNLPAMIKVFHRAKFHSRTGFEIKLTSL
jgi:hypothetical protein